MKPASPSKQIDQSFQCVPCSQAFPILPQIPHNMKWMVPIPNHQSESSFLFRGGKRDGAGSSARASCTRRPRSRASRSTELVRYRRSSLKRDRGPFYWCGGWGQIKRAYYNDESRTKGPWFVAMLTGNGGEAESTGRIVNIFFKRLLPMSEGYYLFDCSLPTILKPLARLSLFFCSSACSACCRCGAERERERERERQRGD